ncbi:serine hydrolase [Streptomyces halobius]|uniref:Class A beta-lactamase-related serine hydrolase n=1 Tax=Streptomyces halobius TaxID=2879846 RepID=A0ABY4MJA2_9ACTN|nr:serine hydrolase [Streptomyces halobius]UQA97292.1 class A beta-lactamase-related serine hydrolase [Streptomyces halobius]
MHVARLGAGEYLSRGADLTYYAASTMKMAVLAALHRSDLDLDAPVPIRNRFISAVPAPPFGITPDWAADSGTWRLLGTSASLRWLARRMIAHSSDLATNICISHVGLDAVNEIWRLAGARHSVTHRGIEDYAARAAGVTNLVTAADLSRLLCWLPPELLDQLAANVHRIDLPAGLPAGTRIALKNGWVRGIRHSAGIVYPPDAAPYVISICYSGRLAMGRHVDDPAARLLARISAGIWSRRHSLRLRGHAF